MSVASPSASGLSPPVASEVGDRGGRFLECAQVCSTLVTLNLYDLSSSWTGLNNVLDTTFAAGAFHTGVVVFGREYYYSGMVADGGAGQRSVSGVYWHEPGEHEVHQFRQSIELGHTSLTPREAQQQMLELSSEWSAPGYHILRRNCVHFAVALCDRLGVGPVPARVQKLSETGAAIADSIAAAANSLQQNLSTFGVGAASVAGGVRSSVDRVAATVGPMSQSISSSSKTTHGGLVDDLFDRQPIATHG
mmetsp:Transcript_25052/g.60761  ORF Transcript_25052/g.60761 Transcript_25052/m.60761 type:complete len:249 (+) Transcript_25052:44-790(+)